MDQVIKGKAGFGQGTRDDTAYAARQRKMESIRIRLAAEIYTVDAGDLADAILRRMHKPGIVLNKIQAA